MWHYLFFIVLIKVKDPTEFTGPESYVYAMIKVRVSSIHQLIVIHVLFTQEKNLDWFPRMRAMSLTADDGEGEQNELRNLQQQLESTNKLVQTLSSQLAELKDQVSIHHLQCCHVTWYNYR
jgi:hypothetical protein